MGTPSSTRKKNLDLQFAQQPTNRIDPETEKKLRQIMTRNGILNINNEQHQTDISDLIDMGELGSGTSGHVVKMRHKTTDTIIAVKVCFVAVNRNNCAMFFIFVYINCMCFISGAANATNGQQ